MGECACTCACPGQMDMGGGRGQHALGFYEYYVGGRAVMCSKTLMSLSTPCRSFARRFTSWSMTTYAQPAGRGRGVLRKYS